MAVLGIPSSQSTKLWAFFGFMHCTYNWRYSDADLKRFKGSLHAVMATVFAQRAEEWVRNFFNVMIDFYNFNCNFIDNCDANNFLFYTTSQERYGVRNANCELKEEDYEKIDLTKFDESDLYQLQSKTMIIIGLLFGLRRNKEHTKMTVGTLEVKCL